VRTWSESLDAAFEVLAKTITPHRAIKPVNKPEIDISGLVVSFLYVLFEKSKHVAVIGLIFLGWNINRFFYHQQMIVLKIISMPLFPQELIFLCLPTA